MLAFLLIFSDPPTYSELMARAVRENKHLAVCVGCDAPTGFGSTWIVGGVPGDAIEGTAVSQTVVGVIFYGRLSYVGTYNRDVSAEKMIADAGKELNRLKAGRITPVDWSRAIAEPIVVRPTIIQSVAPRVQAGRCTT